MKWATLLSVSLLLQQAGSGMRRRKHASVRAHFTPVLAWCPKQATLLSPDARVGETDFTAKSLGNVWMPRGVKVGASQQFSQGLCTGQIGLLAGQLQSVAHV